MEMPMEVPSRMLSECTRRRVEEMLLDAEAPFGGRDDGMVCRGSVRW